MTAAPLLLDVKANALDDGPGIRSVVFFKGCPLACTWCHNPEAKGDDAELSLDPDLCVHSLACQPACPEGALSGSPGAALLLDRTRCTACFECVDRCPSGALSRVGEPTDVENLVARLRRDKPFFDNSGGGVTLSGGEPTRFMEFLSELLQALRREGIHILLQTCGAFGLQRFEALVYPWLDLIYYDLKLVDAEAHRQHCGTGNQTILKNFARLMALADAGGVDVLPRVPLVPGITDSGDNLRGIARLLATHSASRVQLLPYNPLWPDKARKLGFDLDISQTSQRFMSEQGLQHCRQIFEAEGIRCEL